MDPKTFTDGIGLGMKLVKTIFDLTKKDEKPLISVGLAIGYFYNFIEPVSNVIGMGELELQSQDFEGGSKVFDAENIKIQILMPKRLDGYAFNSCETEYKTYSKASVNLKQNGRFYGVNYGIQTMSKKEMLIISDFARPMMAIKRFYEEFQKIDTSDKTSNTWLKIQNAEISAFRETLLTLQERGYSTLPNKIDFQERG